jgi:hypothetical protein
MIWPYRSPIPVEEADILLVGTYKVLHAFAALRGGRGVSTMWYLPIAL